MSETCTFPDMTADEVHETLRSRAQHRRIGGNPPHHPYFWGWVIRAVDADGRSRHTTPDERAWLRSRGFVFRGGSWVRRDPFVPEFAAARAQAEEDGRRDGASGTPGSRKPVDDYGPHRYDYVAAYNEAAGSHGFTPVF